MLVRGSLRVPFNVTLGTFKQYYPCHKSVHEAEWRRQGDRIESGVTCRETFGASSYGTKNRLGNFGMKKIYAVLYLETPCLSITLILTPYPNPNLTPYPKP